MLLAQSGLDVVDPARVVPARRATPSVEHQGPAGQRRGGGDANRLECPILDVVLQLIEGDPLGHKLP